MSNRQWRVQASIEDEALPASFRTDEPAISLPSHQLEAFLVKDLSVDRIEKIESYLWMVGRPQPPRPLNLQIVLGRTIVAATDASLHLVWTPGKIFVKPLPAFFFKDAFYEQYLRGTSLYPPALGFLFTYVALLQNEIDFKLALEANLIPSHRTWQDWKSLSHRFLVDYPGRSIYAHLSHRYQYGELRLGRLDGIYRYLMGDWLHGYSSLTGTPTYGHFFADNMRSIASAAAYIVIVLTAMTLAIAIEPLASNLAFQRACYGFAIFSMISPLAVVGILILVFLVLFIANWWRTSLAQRKCKAEREEIANRDKNVGHDFAVELGMRG